ncbi:MAG: hypothetical protein KAW41_01385 [Candidatus Diapherotrites archaeon]|nr:hypothetical protein [Candidatus Diapherotrites archaeon]
MEKRIETTADEFLMMVRREKKMSLPELQKALGVKRHLLDEWIGMFESRGMIELIYPANPLSPPYVVIKNG